MVGGGGDLGLRGLQYLLVTAVDELGNFSANQVARVGENFHPFVPVLLDGRRHVVLLEEDASLGARRFDQIEAVITQPLHAIFVSSFFNFGWQISS